MAKLTEEVKEEYERLQIEKAAAERRIQEIENLPTVYGYARVSTLGQAKGGNSLEAQERELRAAGAEEIFSDAFTGTKVDRPELNKLLGKVKAGDKIIVTKLDRVARNIRQGLELIDDLNGRGVTIHVLNMGEIDDKTPTGQLIKNIMLSFAEFERQMIVQRTQEGKAIVRQREGFHEGRPKKYSEEQSKLAVELLDQGHSYSQVVKMTGISKSTLIRIKKSYAAM